MVDLKKVWPGWEIEELIGQGAYGKVYRIKKEEFGETYKAALKIIEIPSDESEVHGLINMGMDNLSIRDYFEGTARNITNEIRIMESLKSAGNIVHVEEHTLLPHEEGVGWTILIRMELLESLRNYQTRAGMPDVKETVKLGLDICGALACCEEKQIIHRDIKPENIFRNEFGMYKLGDFGIARQMENTKSAYSQKGTSGYMAPEINRGEKYDQTVDIYSLGIMMYRFLNRQRMPFLPTDTNKIGPNDIQNAQMRRLMGEALPAPCDADPALAAIVLKACDPNPSRRYRNAEQFAKALTDWQNGVAEMVVEPVTKTQAAPMHWNSTVTPAIQNQIDSVTIKPDAGVPQKPVTGVGQNGSNSSVSSGQNVYQPSGQNVYQPSGQNAYPPSGQNVYNRPLYGTTAANADAAAHRSAEAVKQAQTPVQHWSVTAQRPGFAGQDDFYRGTPVGQGFRGTGTNGTGFPAGSGMNASGFNGGGAVNGAATGNANPAAPAAEKPAEQTAASVQPAPTGSIYNWKDYIRTFLIYFIAAVLCILAGDLLNMYFGIGSGLVRKYAGYGTQIIGHYLTLIVMFLLGLLYENAMYSGRHDEAKKTVRKRVLYTKNAAAFAAVTICIFVFVYLYSVRHLPSITRHPNDLVSLIIIGVVECVYIIAAAIAAKRRQN